MNTLYTCKYPIVLKVGENSFSASRSLFYSTPTTGNKYFIFLKTMQTEADFFY
jgi:hypothetical protein